LNTKKKLTHVKDIPQTLSSLNKSNYSNVSAVLIANGCDLCPSGEKLPRYFYFLFRFLVLLPFCPFQKFSIFQMTEMVRLAFKLDNSL